MTTFDEVHAQKVRDARPADDRIFDESAAPEYSEHRFPPAPGITSLPSFKKAKEHSAKLRVLLGGKV